MRPANDVHMLAPRVLTSPLGLPSGWRSRYTFSVASLKPAKKVTTSSGVALNGKPCAHRARLWCEVRPRQQGALQQRRQQQCCCQAW